jgi:hypothetical protein
MCGETIRTDGIMIAGYANVPCGRGGGVEARVADDDNVSGTSCRRQDTACVRGCGQVFNNPDAIVGVWQLGAKGALQ